MARFLLLLCFGPLFAVESLPVPVPQQIPDAQAFAVVVVPDLLGTLGRCEQIANLFAPGQVKGGDFATQIGTTIGDPGLLKLGKGPVLIAIGPGGMAPSTAFIIPSSEPQLYIGALSLFNLQAEAVGELVVAGQKPADLALGKRIAESYAALSAMAIDGDLRMLIAPARVANAYRPVLAGFTKVMVGQVEKQPNGAEAAALLSLEIQGFFAVVGDLDTVQIDVELTAASIASRTVVSTIPGSKLAAALLAPPASTIPAPALRMGNEPGYMLFTGRINSPALHGWMADLLVDLQQMPEGQKIISPEMITMVRDMGTAFEGGMAMRMHAAEGNPLSMDYVVGCRDEAALAMMYERMVNLMFGDTLIGKMYSEIGMSAVVEKDTRTSGTASVNRIHYGIDADKMPADQAEQMKAMMHDVEYAAIPDFAVASTQPTVLDRLVQGGAGELVTSAVSSIGPGRDCYVDFDWLGMTKAFMGAMPVMNAMPFAAALAAAPAGEPSTTAWTIAESRALLEINLPLKPFADLMGIFQAQPQGEIPPADDQPVF